ncbi:MAG: bifunctional DNA-formamidopyrimidine glycosylase/DNA-(apurinic or apyrimidinic site) lyase [Magnetococcales bacterium]|nr:bifunctional DNA-formamidopyrimidine glycosylase/DNA-(apurinic or apyrimidinic site) lyase [Magnetococcales bacterium]
MPELPEVETVCRGLQAFLPGSRVVGLQVRERRLRWPVPVERMTQELVGTDFQTVTRRGKYLLLRADLGVILLHLGMSGVLSGLATGVPPGRHDHVDFLLADGRLLRYNDPRRFGAILWTREAPESHPLLASLGPEPLGRDFSAAFLFRISRGRTRAVKSLLMDSRVVVGVGNIYASEALFRAGVDPTLPAGRLSRRRCGVLARAVREVLTEAVARGGTSLRNFKDCEGRPGYFRQELRVYGREGESCPQCGRPLSRSLIAGRATFHCVGCQC